MSKCFIEGMGGGSGVSLKEPRIIVTFPIGSICTCTNGEKTYKAKDTNGFWAFGNLDFGNWTVTATDPADPTNTASETVEITTEGQSVSVVLEYILYIVKNGKIKAEATYDGMSGTVAGDILTIKQTVSVRNDPLYANYGPVDITTRSKMYVELAGSNCHTQYTNTVGIATAKNAGSPAAGASIGNADTSTKTIDVSKYTGEYYVIFRIETRSNIAYVNVKNLWFE